MILLVSHFAKNKGVTDFFIDYLLEKEHDFYLLKHPFGFAESDRSELYLYSRGTPTLISTYRKVHPDIFNLLKNFIVSTWISYKLGTKVDKVISFGSFNSVPFILTDILFKRKKYFWGVDYSTKRFSNTILNKIYLFLEMLACKYSTLVISQSQRQADARIKNHHLEKSKSIVSSNGINRSTLGLNFSNYSEVSLLYIGSITKQHGIIDFVDYFYIQNDIPYSLHIIGSGEEEVDLLKTIRRAKHPERIIYGGFKTIQETTAYISNIHTKIFGIAPYSDAVNDHVYYGDSLKIKEYLSYNIPYIASDVVLIPDDLKPFGIIYISFQALLSSLSKEVTSFSLQTDEKNKVLQLYTWRSLFEHIMTTLRI